MKLSQSRAIPLAILATILAAATAMFMFSGQSVFGHNAPADCNTANNVGLTIIILDENGDVITRTAHGSTVTYQVILSIPELPSDKIACNFEGGQVTITLPNGETQNVAGFDGTPEIGLIARGSVAELPGSDYTVDQTHAVNSALTATANYTAGVVHSGEDETAHPTISATATGFIYLKPPSISIAIDPDTQNVYEGGDADFRVTVTNTGDLELTTIQIVDSLETSCERSFDILAVGDSTEFDCDMSPAQSGRNEFTVTAAVVAGVPGDLSSVRDMATSTITIEDVAIEVEIVNDTPRVRLGNESTFTITVSNPNTTGLVGVKVKVEAATECDRDEIGDMEAGSTEVYVCASQFDSGRTPVEAVAQGTVVGVGGLTDSATVDAEVFELDLTIQKTVEQDPINTGDTAQFTVKVNNYGNTDLDDVVVDDHDLSPGCDMALGTLKSQTEFQYQCESTPLEDDTGDMEITVTGIAPDGQPVTHSDSIAISVLRPSTIVAVEEVDTTVLRLVVQVLTITETNNGDSPLTDVFVDVSPSETRLNIDSKEFLGGDDSGDRILDPGETWEWRMVIVSVAGDHVVVAGNAGTIDVTATGHGTDQLDNDITWPGYATEQHTLKIPITVQ